MASASIFQIITTPPSINPSVTDHRHLTTNLRPFHRQTLRHRRLTTTCSYKISIEHEGKTTEIEVESDETILEKALETGMDVPHDCKLGVCMTCPAKLLSGNVDQSEGMLSDDVIERGYSLLCVSYPKSDCVVKIIPEEELLSLQLATADD
ncbi:ferredoxin C 1, chloroplastic [Rutidosis leptorrhynchoides]|uniref:ferredoxin C 1, chloroplastic n=1 Tax=Rutidosis leptorrhynchoides TaxID=125765 RepID=UPI003A99E024